MGVDSIEVGHAENGFRTNLHEDNSTHNLVGKKDLEDTPFSGAESDLENISWRPGIREWLLLSSISLIAIMDAFNATMMIPLVPDLSKTFEKPLRSALWIDASYLLANAASQPLFAMLSEVFGQGPILIISVIIATAGTGACNGSINMSSLVAGRLVQGVGSGGSVAVSLLVMADLIPCSHRIRFFDYICRAWVIGAVLGPVLGGLFGEYADWTCVFYYSFAFCALSLLVIPFAIDLRECRSISSRAACEMDWLGAALTLVGIGCLLIGLSWLGEPPLARNDWRILVCSCLGGLAMLILVLYEAMWVEQPMFNLEIFNSIPTIMLYIGSSLNGLLLLCHLQNLIMYLTFAKCFSLFLTGLSMLTITAPILPALFLTAKMRVTRNPYLSRWVIRAGWFLNLLASGCFILLSAGTPAPGWVFIFFATGLSHAFIISGYNMATPVGAPAKKGSRQVEYIPSRKGRAGSPAFAILMYSILRTWGMCIAVPVSGTIVLMHMAQEGEGNSVGSSGSMLRLGDDGGELEVGFLDGFHIVWRFFMGVSALGGLSSMFIR